MADIKYPRYYIYNQERLAEIENIEKDRKTPHKLRQDKRGLVPAWIASDQPTRIPDELRADRMGSFSIQAPIVNNRGLPLVQLIIWVRPGVKLWAMREAAKLGVSLSSFCSKIFELAAQNHITLELSPQLYTDFIGDIRQELALQQHRNEPVARDVQMIKQLLSYNLEYTAGKEKIENLLSLAHARANEEMAYRTDKLYGRTDAPAINPGESAYTAGEEYGQLDSLPLEKITLYVKPDVKAWVKQQAGSLRLPLSSFASPLFEKAVQHDINLEASPELKPIFKKVIRSEFRGGRQLAAQEAHDVQMIKQLLSYLLEHTPGIGKEKLKQLLEIANARADEEIKNRLKNAYGTSEDLPEEALPQGAIYAHDTKHEAKGAPRSG